MHIREVGLVDAGSRARLVTKRDARPADQVLERVIFASGTWRDVSDHANRVAQFAVLRLGFCVGARRLPQLGDIRDLHRAPNAHVHARLWRVDATARRTAPRLDESGFLDGGRDRMSHQRGVCRCTQFRKSVGIRVQDIFEDAAKSCDCSAQLSGSRSQCVDGVRVDEVEWNILAAVRARGRACARTARDACQNLQPPVQMRMLRQRPEGLRDPSRGTVG
jgi:hypothetical protein